MAVGAPRGAISCRDGIWVSNFGTGRTLRATTYWQPIRKVFGRRPSTRSIAACCPSRAGFDRVESDGDWRRSLRTRISWALVAKLLALTLLWFLFFRGDHS